VTLTNLGTAENVKIVYAANGTSVTQADLVSGDLPMNNTGASVTLNNSSPGSGVTISWQSDRMESSQFSVRSESQTQAKRLILGQPHLPAAT